MKRRKSDERFQRLFEDSGEAIFLHGVDGKILDVNDRACVLLRYTRNALQRMSLQDLHAPETRDESARACAEVLETGAVSFESALLCGDGERINVDIQASVFDESPKIIQGIVRDLTESHRTGQALLSSERRLKQVAENAQEWVWEVDADGCFTYASPVVEEMLGYPPDEVVRKKRFHDFFHPDERDTLMETSLALLARREPFREFINRNEAKDGRSVWFSTSGVPLFDVDSNLIGYRGASADITERTHVERELREEKQKLLTILSNIGESVVAMDEEYTILFMSGDMLQEIGDRTGEKCYVAFCGSEAPCGINCAVDEVIKGRKDVFQYTHSDKEDFESGRIAEEMSDRNLSRDYETVARPFLYEGKRCVMEILRDVTERKRGEEERAALEAQLRQSQKMEAVGQLAGGIAHDFNNLLQAIMGYTQLSMARCSPEQQVYQDLAQVKKAGDKAAALTRQLLAFSRRQAIRPLFLDMNKVIGDVLKMLRRVIGEHIELKVDAGDNLDVVHADPGMLEQVLMNLCVNARDAMPAGGCITIKTRNVSLDYEYCREHPWVKPGRHVHFSVSDTGTGMSPDLLEHIFEPFFSTKEEEKGTGLGLATVYGIVRQHEGFIHVRSKPGQGASFHIYLPTAQEPVSSVAEARDVLRVGGTETLLVAEDDENVRTLTTRILEEHGYTVLTAVDGEEAVRVFESNREMIELAILDVVMPRMGGQETRDRMLAVRPELSILFLSGYNPGANETGYVIEDGVQLLQKPVSHDLLLERVREILDTPRGS